MHDEPISMLDALCGLIAKINRRKNNDLTTRQIDMFNRIVKDFAKDMLGDENALNAELVEMVYVGEETVQDDWGNGLFSIG